MRAAVGLALVTVCLGLAGCSLFGKKHAARNDPNPKPFLGSEKPAKVENAAMPRDTVGPLPGANGVLAGRVIIESTGRPVRASILIKSRDRDEGKAADLDFATDESGFFTFTKLNVGEHYELVARANDNGELISRTIWATPPKPTLLIALDKRYTTQSTPPPPQMPKTPGNKPSAKESTQEGKPTVKIDGPIKLPDQPSQPPESHQPEAPARTNIPNPANIAEGDFHRIKQPPYATIPNPPPLTQPPQWEAVPEQRRPAPPIPGSPGSVQMPKIETPVPSCGLYADRLDNFALYDLNGKVWEYKKDRHSHLLLLDFWSLNCMACLHCVPDLIELQRKYKTYGLEIIGIADEPGTWEEKQERLKPFLNRVNYKILPSGRGTVRCPVMEQFGVERLPSLFLIDSDGKIIWRSPRDGMDDNAFYVLEKKIRDRLVAREPPP